MEEKNNVLQVTDGSFIPEIPNTLELPNIENPDDREYENVETEVEGGV